jgi:lipoate-protein ligase B
LNDRVTETRKDCWAVFLGRTDYARALDLQMQISRARKEGRIPDVLLLLEHPHTITLGRNGNWAHLLVSHGELRGRGVELFTCDRGGDITYHGPGQLVGYPILQLASGERDVHLYMRSLEESLIQVLSAHGIQGNGMEKMTGVWTEKGKIASMGVHISRWITRHGFALNVNTDLSFFRLIVPCGMVDRRITSMLELSGRHYALVDVAEQYFAEFEKVFHRRLERIDENALCQRLREVGETATR